MSRNITPYKVSQLPIKQDNINLFLYRYKVKQSVKNADIQKVAEQLTGQVQEMLADAKLDFAPQVMVTQLYDKSLGWQSGGFSDPDDEVKFYDFKNEYEYKGNRIQDSFTMFNLAIKLVPPAGGCDGEMNDCLWYCLRSIVNKDVDRLPKALNTQKKLKRFLKVKRLDPVHVDRIPSIEAKMEINLHIVGDIERRSAGKNYKREAVITLKNGHYSYKNPTISKQLRGATNVKDKQIIMYEGVPTEDGNVQHWAHDGEKTYKVSREVISAFRIKPYGCKYIYRATAKARGKQVLSLEEQYDNYIEDTDELFEKSGGLINLRRQLTEKKAALFVFAKLKEGYAEPDPITCIEGRWIHSARSGGLIKATPAKLEYAICYDINKMYAAMLVHDKFTVPMKEGKFATISQQEMDAMLFFKYGIYKCRITNPDKVSTRLFHYSETKSYHTHFSLTTARELGLRITMAEENDNALLYADGRLHGRKLFGPFVKRIMEVFGKVKGETKPRCKKIMNCLWGGLTMLNNTEVDLNKEKILDLQHREITHIEPFKEQYVVNLHDYRHRYKTDYARLGPFLTSFARRQMYLTFKDVEQYVYRVHTDGVVLSKPMKELPLGDGVGEWKVEKEGACEVVNANVVEWE